MDLSKLRKYAESPLSKVVDNKTFLGENTDRSDITTVVYETYKTIDNLAMYAREKTDSFISQLMQVSVDELCDFNIKNGIFMNRLMDINAKEKEITLNALGTNVPLFGNSHENGVPVLSPSYAEEFNYQEIYVKKLASNEGSDNSGRTQGATNETYLNPYGEVINYYPDDNGTWETDGKDGNTPTSKWDAKNKNSVLYKTKKLFINNKINTIISRFHTDTNTPKNDLDVKTKYGLSHGRNLLTKEAEDGQNTYKSNGYDNPYCRVWTHHHQYDRLDKLIRPFVTKDENGESKPVGLMDFHNWQNFKMTNKKSETGNGDNEKANEWGWKYNNDAWKYSVLQDNGFVNITPKYVNGGATNIHTKQCMFSIENLAWRDFDPYSFEKALSWEQRGPMGGRIMWFPPYGITFNETTQTNWNGSTFIGRGEDVYTYINTKRSGTLNFMLVVDHPSINDYVSFYEANHKKVHDTDLLRFQAGCDESGTTTEKQVSIDEFKEVNKSEDIYAAISKGEVYKPKTTKTEYNGMTGLTQPTPLTDEYIEKKKPIVKSVEKKEKPKEPEPTPDEIVTITFFVFYPNNYSGYYDRQKDSKVEPIAYLLFGNGAQIKRQNGNVSEDLDLSFDNINDKNIGNGYEMSVEGKGITTDKDGSNYLNGSLISIYNNKGEINGTTRRHWYYRIDGTYKNNNFNGKDNPPYSNCLNQNLGNNKDRYADEKSIGYNIDISQIKQNFKQGVNEDYLCSLAEIAKLLTPSKKVSDLLEKKSVSLDNERINRIREVLESKETDGTYSYELLNIKSTGFSNSHAYNNSNKINANRNFTLASERAITPVEWLFTMRPEWKEVEVEYIPQQDNRELCVSGKNNIECGTISVDVEKTEAHNESGDNAKLYRSAKVELTFSRSKTKSLSDADTQTNLENASSSEFKEGFIKHSDGKHYINPNETDNELKGRLWVYDEKSQQMILEYIDGVDNRSRYKSNKTEEDGKFLGNNWSNEGADRLNKYRYDQEYHFFKVLKQKDPIVFDKLMSKLQYFNPAYHSMTPEGFSARLTFLQQCTRQGDTNTATDRTPKSANNLAFGRPPFCVLRLGDFYNQMIVIDNISINYDPLVWDLNTEGIGVIPLIANVSISFTFIGGSSMYGPVQRLQNAMSFNYYANSNLYDNRSDRPQYNWDVKTNGALDHSLQDNSYFHTVQTYNKTK